MDLFIVNFNPMPKITIVGDTSSKYLIEIYEYRNGIKELITDYVIPTNNFISFFREWYGDYEIEVYNWNEENKLHMVANHRYNDLNKEVLINLDTSHLNETLIWLSRALEYRDIHKCKLTIKSPFIADILEVDSKVKVVNDIKSPDDYYAIYNIGKYDTEYEWNKKLTQTNLNQVWNKNRTYCSYRNPRNWNQISLDDVAADILGLNEI